MDYSVKTIPRHFILSKSRYGSFRLVCYKDNTDDILDNQSLDVAEKQDKMEDSKLKDIDDQPAGRNYELEALLRAKRTILDLALNNPFTHFVTFTFDRRKIDRNNVTLSKDRLLKAVDNYNSRNKDIYKLDYKPLQYIAVPEWHKKKDAIHFHCLMSNMTDLEFSHIDRENGYKVFISPYFFERFGSVQAIPISDYNKFITYYITKYVTKQNLNIFDTSKHRYFRSNGMERSLILGKGNLGKLYSDQVNAVKTTLEQLTPDYETNFLRIYNLDDLDIVQQFIEITNEEIA